MIGDLERIQLAMPNDRAMTNTDRSGDYRSTSAEPSPSTASVAKCTAVKVEKVGQLVSSSDAPHQKSNHFIVQSRPYFPNAKLRAYVCACPKLRGFAVPCLFVSFLGILSVWDAIGRIPALIFLVLDLIWVAIFIQHEWVNKKSLPVVLKQGVIQNQEHLNEFYTVTVTELTGVTLENHRANIGVVKLAQGKIQFQAFNPQAVMYMATARRWSRTMLAAYLFFLETKMFETDRLLSRDQVAVSGANYTQVSVKDVGRSVVIGTAPHVQTNHFIKQSRKYFPRRKLQTYLCGFSQFRALMWLLFVASCLGALSLLGGYYKAVPAYSFVLCAVGIAILAQHEVINRKTLPVVFLQPTIDGQRSLNAFYRVTVTELSGMTLANYRAGIGYVELSEGSIEFQAFNREAIRSIKRAQKFSRVSLFLFVCAAVYNLYFLMAVSFGITFS